MNLLPATIALLLQLSVVTGLRSGLYTRNYANARNNKLATNNISPNRDDIWNVFKQKLGLSRHKIQLLKSQKDQQGTLELLNRFIEENPKHIVNAEKPEAVKSSNNFVNVYHNLLKQLGVSRGALKTSLNLELADKPQKSLKRSRRTISVKMVSDLPSDKIDELINIFSEKHGISKLDKENDHDDIDSDSSETEDDYNDISSVKDTDYLYENLYEDERDLSQAAKSNRNSQYASFQDLILQASRNQWQRDREETKLGRTNNEHFV